MAHRCYCLSYSHVNMKDIYYYQNVITRCSHGSVESWDIYRGQYDCFCNNTPSGMFLSWDLLCKHWLELVAMDLPCIKLIFSTRILFRGVSCCVTGCLFCVRYRVLSTCPMYVGARLAKLFYMTTNLLVWYSGIWFAFVIYIYVCVCICVCMSWHTRIY